MHSTSADWALLHLGRASTTGALVTAWYRDVRLGVGEADSARRLATDGRLGSLQTAGVKLRVGERRHGDGWRRRPFQRHRSRKSNK